MNQSGFDNIFSSTLDNEAAFFSNEAMEYLAELEEMRDRFGECTNSLQYLKKHLALLYQAVEKYKATIHLLQSINKEKDREISSLRAQLEKGGFNWSPVDLGKIELQVKALEQQIRAEIEKYKRTGKYANIEQSINNVRNLFDTALHELNKANAQNQNVDSILKTLLTLENCEKALRKTRKDLRESQYPVIVVTPPL